MLEIVWVTQADQKFILSISGSACVCHVLQKVLGHPSHLPYVYTVYCPYGLWRPSGEGVGGQSSFPKRSWDIPEQQNGRPAITARCSDHKWTSHNKAALLHKSSAAEKNPLDSTDLGCVCVWCVRAALGNRETRAHSDAQSPSNDTNANKHEAWEPSCQ